MSKRVRMSPEGRREVILRAAVDLTREANGCLDSWSRQDVASKCTPPTSPETVKHYYLMPDLRDAVRALLDK
jgi:hypothetical protein